MQVEVWLALEGSVDFKFDFKESVRFQRRGIRKESLLQAEEEHKESLHKGNQQ